MSTGFTISQIGNYSVDLDDVLVRRELFSDGTLWNWGYNLKGQLGTNNTSSYSSPVTTVAGGINWKFSDGRNHTSAIKTDGTLWIWGTNLYGQLGTNNTSSYSSPVTTIAGGTNWKTVACGYSHTAAIKTDGTLWIWGRNDVGQLGLNNVIDKSSPVTTVIGGTNWKSVSCGYKHSAAIKTDGTLWVWGYNNQGQLGTNDTSSYSSPVTTAGGGTNWKQVSCSHYLHTAAIKTDGTLWVWGYNNFGELGTNNNIFYSSPVTIFGGGNNWKQVDLGSAHSSAIKTDGTLWTWGRNFNGQLGVNDTTDRSSPTTTIAGGTNWKQLSCGADHTAAIKTDGTLWTWGANASGQLGTNNTSGYSSPVTTVAGGTNWKTVACGGGTIIATTDLTI